METMGPTAATIIPAGVARVKEECVTFRGLGHIIPQHSGKEGTHW